MAEWASVEQYEGSDPKTVVFRIPNQNLAFTPGAQVNIYETSRPSIWRVRYVSIFGALGGTVGSVTLTFQGLTSSAVGDPWTDGGPLVSTCPTNIPFGEGYHFAWSSDVDTSYSGFNTDFGRSAVTALPLLFLPGLTQLSIYGDGVGGFDGDFSILGGQLELEKFPPSVLSGGGQGQGPSVYLLPQTI